MDHSKGPKTWDKNTLKKTKQLRKLLHPKPLNPGAELKVPLLQLVQSRSPHQLFARGEKSHKQQKIGKIKELCQRSKYTKKFNTKLLIIALLSVYLAFSQKVP